MGTPSKLQKRMNRTGSDRAGNFSAGVNFTPIRNPKQQPSGSLDDLDVQRLLAAYNDPQRRRSSEGNGDYPNVSIDGDGLSSAVCGQTAFFHVTDPSSATQTVQAYVLHAAFKIKAECTSVCTSAGNWNLSYAVTTAGKWELYVYVCGSAGQMPVRNSPFSVFAVPNAVSPKKCKLDGPGLSQAKQAEQNTFLLTLMDAHGNVVVGKDYEIRIRLSDCRYEHQTRWQADGKVQISYTPIVRKHTSIDSIDLEVFVGDQLVQGSSFSVPYYCTPEQIEEELGHILKSLADVRVFLRERRTSGWVRRKKRVQWKQTFLRIALIEGTGTPGILVRCFASEDAHEPTEQIPLLDTEIKPFTTKRMLAGELEGFMLLHGTATVEFGCVSKADRDEWCENIQAMIKFSGKYLGLESMNNGVEHKQDDEHAKGANSTDRTGLDKFMEPFSRMESKEDFSDAANGTMLLNGHRNKADATTHDVVVHIPPANQQPVGFPTATTSTTPPPQAGDLDLTNPAPVGEFTPFKRAALSTDSNELRRSEAATASTANVNHRRFQVESNVARHASPNRATPSTNTSPTPVVPSTMPDHDDLEEFFLAGNSALLANGHAKSMEHPNLTRTKSYIRASFVDPSKDSRIATPDQSPERRRGQVDKMDSLQADAAQWNRVMKWLKSIGQTKYADNFKRHGLAQLAIIELLSMDDLIDMGVEEDDRNIILEEIVKFSASTMKWASKAMQDDTLSRTSSHTTVLADPLQNELMTHFDAHDKDAFFSLWQTVVPVESLRSADHLLYQTTRSLEFYLHVYFAICPVLDGADDATLQKQMIAFRSYVEAESRKGGLLAQSADFAAYAGLFLIPQPNKNPAFKGLFQEEWTDSLRERVHAYLAVVLGRGSETDWGEHPLSPPKQKMLQFDPAAVNLPTRPLALTGSPEQAHGVKHPKIQQDPARTPSRQRRSQSAQSAPRSQSVDRSNSRAVSRGTRSAHESTGNERAKSRQASRPRQSTLNGTAPHSPIHQVRQQRTTSVDVSSHTTTPASKSRGSQLHQMQQQRYQRRAPQSHMQTQAQTRRQAHDPQPRQSTGSRLSSTRDRTQSRQTTTNTHLTQRLRVGPVDSRAPVSRAGETDDISKLRAMIQAKRQSGARVERPGAPPYPPGRVAHLGVNTGTELDHRNEAPWNGDHSMVSPYPRPASPGKKQAGSRFDYWNGSQLTSVL